MNRFWLAPRDSYSRSFLLPSGKNGRKPKKEIGADGKLIEPQDLSSITTRDIANSIMDGKPASKNPEAALQKIFSILAVFPSLRLGLIDSDDLTVSGDGTAVVSHTSPYGRHLPVCAHSCTLIEAAVGVIIPPLMPAGDGTTTKKHGISDILCTCLYQKYYPEN